MDKTSWTFCLKRQFNVQMLLLVWIVGTLIALIWEFVLLSILFSYDTTVGRSSSPKNLQNAEFLHCLLKYMEF